MGSTGEPDRKRRLSSSLSPAADPAPDPAPAAKRPSTMPSSEEKKLDVAVLRFRNQKLCEELEVKKFEYYILENKLKQLKEKQKARCRAVASVKNSWEKLVRDLEPISACTRVSQKDTSSTSCTRSDYVSSSVQKDFIARLTQSGATESSGCMSSETPEINLPDPHSQTVSVLQNIMSTCHEVWHQNRELCGSLLATLPPTVPSLQLKSRLENLFAEFSEVTNALDDLRLKHKEIVENYQSQRDSKSQGMAEQRLLRAELGSTVRELEECSRKLAILKAQSDVSPGTVILYPSIGSRESNGDKARDRQKELQNLQAACKELMDSSLKRLQETEKHFGERIEILQKLATYQNLLTSVKSISSSKAFQTLLDQHQKSLEEMEQCRASLEKLQVEKDRFLWREQEVTLKVDMADIPQRMSDYCQNKIVELEETMRRLNDQKVQLEARLEESLREPGRREVISEFRNLKSSFPREMESMQTELTKFKDDASRLHCLRAEVQSLSSMLSRMDLQIKSLSHRAAQCSTELTKLRTTDRDLQYSNQELKLFLEMYKRESTDSRDVLESRDREYKERAAVQRLKLSLDDHRLELRVKAANEAEALAQQRLVAAEADIAVLRDKLEASGREIGSLSEQLKSKHEEGEAYSSEIDSIGQAYVDMQSQNQQMLQQITERDDHNITLVLENIRARQVLDMLNLDVRTLEQRLQQSNSLAELHNHKLLRLDNQLRCCSERVGKLTEEKCQNTATLENAHRKLVETQGDSQKLRQEMDGIQEKFARSRQEVSELLVELEKERFSKKRIDEDLEVISRKATNLRIRTESSAVINKLRQEVREYRGILKCSICRDRQKEVVITKCYHLFCGPCINKLLTSRQRRCPSCSSSFGANDVKSIYI